MIPILYEKDEMQFASNGLGRLRDCTKCIVFEERNGLYEIDFDYPVDGHNFDQIIPGRIIGVTHDDTSDIQPFDIVSYDKTINGVVTFHGVHISYRLLKVVANGSNINSLTNAISMLNNGTPTNPFTIEADFDSSAYFAAADGVPKSVRQFLGGIEGSLLDSYGGELLFDKFNVKLLQARGEYKPVKIRYGLNLTDYNEETDYLSTYTSVIPYWKGSDANGNDTVVVGNMVDSELTSYSGRNECVPLDLTDKFETIPSIADLQSFALNQITGDAVNLPNRSIEVKYIDLKDFGEYDTIANLIQCKLCDTINVVFPRFNMNARFKIVKTEYNVLQDRFESMELGKLSTTLAEALGITADSTLGRISESGIADVIVDKGTNGKWYYEKYESGLLKGWYFDNDTTTTLTTSSGNGWYRNANPYSISMSGLGLIGTPQYASITVNCGLAHVFATVSSLSASSIQYYVSHLGTYSNRTSDIHATIVGKWK